MAYFRDAIGYHTNSMTFITALGARDSKTAWWIFFLYFQILLSMIRRNFMQRLPPWENLSVLLFVSFSDFYRALRAMVKPSYLRFQGKFSFSDLSGV